MASRKQSQGFEARHPSQKSCPTVPSDEKSDKQLVQRFQAGQREAFDELHSRHWQAAYREARRILGNEADALDAVQDGFANALTGLGQFRREASFKTWLLRIVSNAALTIGRKKNCRRDNEAQFAAYRSTEDTRTPDATLLDNEMWASIATILQHNATATMWKICVLYFQENLSLREIAAVLETTVWQVRKDKDLLLKRIQEHLARGGWLVD